MDLRTGGGTVSGTVWASDSAADVPVVLGPVAQSAAGLAAAAEGAVVARAAREAVARPASGKVEPAVRRVDCASEGRVVSWPVARTTSAAAGRTARATAAAMASRVKTGKPLSVPGSAPGTGRAGARVSFLLTVARRVRWPRPRTFISTARLPSATPGADESRRP